MSTETYWALQSPETGEWWVSGYAHDDLVGSLGEFKDTIPRNGSHGKDEIYRQGEWLRARGMNVVPVELTLMPKAAEPAFKAFGIRHIPTGKWVTTVSTTSQVVPDLSDRSSSWHSSLYGRVELHLSGNKGAGRMKVWTDLSSIRRLRKSCWAAESGADTATLGRFSMYEVVASDGTVTPLDEV
jgi:hypothetical protein